MNIQRMAYLDKRRVKTQNIRVQFSMSMLVNVYLPRGQILNEYIQCMKHGNLWKKGVIILKTLCIFVCQGIVRDIIVILLS